MVPLTPEQFAGKVRAKYPGAYDDLSDADLSNKVLAKYPQYQSQVAIPMAASHTPTTPTALDMTKAVPLDNEPAQPSGFVDNLPNTSGNIVKNQANAWTRPSPGISQDQVQPGGPQDV